MNIVMTLLVVSAALVGVFLQSVCDVPRDWLGAQVDVLPGLMAYVGLTAGLAGITLVAVVAGLSLDAMSANPLGVTVLPLFAVGLAIQQFRHLILRDTPYAQWVLGLGASAAVPLLALLVLVTVGQNPLLGVGSLWQWLVVSLCGGALTPLYFQFFDWLARALSYRPMTQTSFRPDRQIERGRR